MRSRSTRRLGCVLSSLLAAIGLAGPWALPAGAAIVPEDGAVVFAWGYNYDGQVGDGLELVNRYSPFPVTGLGTGVTAIAAGFNHSLALKNGAVYAWGANNFGQVGDGGGPQPNRLTPVPVSSMGSGVTAIAGGYDHSLAVQSGTLYAWGWNALGALGDGTTTDRYVPVQVSGMGSGVSAVGGGDLFSLAVKDGAAYGWGANARGQLGDGTRTESHTPAAVTSMSSGVTAIASGGGHSLAVQNGALYSWGHNQYGQLGDGTTTDRTTPVPLSGMGSGVTAIAGGRLHSLAVKNGMVYAWGYNGYGELGDGTTNIGHNTPILVAGLSNIIEVAAGSDSSYALSADGSLWAWGANFSGQLGLGDTANRLTPTLVPAPANFRFVAIDVDAEGGHVLALGVPEPGMLAAMGVVAGVMAMRRRRGNKGNAEC